RPLDLEQEVVLRIKMDGRHGIRGRQKDERLLSLNAAFPLGVWDDTLQARVQESLVLRVLFDVPEHHPASVVLDSQNGFGWAATDVRGSTWKHHRLVCAMTLDSFRRK